ncbi:MAG: hypothetical protein F4029_09355 [Gammaproteobacteria bacterium]|nr:hypothetical protein [Gammaproteobacteria bacterium]MYF27268.1 hypothetical protein [Gammaproteobacteria bacterium]MYK46423.1 hypothetical protein [Gammaproteobacteria bacterium]
MKVAVDHGSRGRLSYGMLVFCAVATCFADAADAPDARDIVLAPGSSELLRFTVDVGTAFIADPGIADVNVLDARNLFVLGRAPGITSLKVHDADGKLLGVYAIRVNVVREHAETVVAKVVGDDGDVEVESVGGALFVTGTVKSPAQAERLLRGIGAVSAAPVIDALTLQTLAQVNLEVLISEVSRNVTRELGIDWSLDMNPFLHPLRTWASGAGTRLGTGALQLARIYEGVIGFGAVDPANPNWKPTDNLDEVLFANEVEELGLEGPVRSADGGIVLSHAEIVNRGEHRATAFLEALAQNGLVVVHARPTLTSVSGESADFFSGLEVPIPAVTNQGVVGTEYRQTGVSLTFTPTVLDRSQISLTVQARIREIAAGGATIAGAQVPNINERSASTTVELGDGESIAIAGLYRRSTTASDGGVPMLKDIPLWGSLFRTSQETDRSVELIIVVTPRIVAAVPRTAVASSRRNPASTARQFDNEFYY